jgi:feruloyl-CoA synthase
MGDAVAWVDPADPQNGFRFDGRIAEDFKLATGTWVDVGKLKDIILRTLHPYVTDVVVTGHDRDYVGALAIPASPAIAQDGAARRDIAGRLHRLAHDGSGSSMHVRRLAFLADPLSLDAGEITDKGSINQRQVLRSRAALVDALYADKPPAGVLVVAEDFR